MDGRSAGLFEEDETRVSNPKKIPLLFLFFFKIVSKHSGNAKNIKTAGQNH